ncbi:putative protein family UPF0756, transmembrame [Haemophilus haemolyticus M19107]|nr:putative protein family UPF0756, transmembrame [Haemophilus haemolyticus M19107]
MYFHDRMLLKNFLTALFKYVVTIQYNRLITGDFNYSRVTQSQQRNYHFCCRITYHAANFFIFTYSFARKIGVKIGIIILTIGVLSPLVSGKIQLPDLSGFLSWKMALSISVGVLVAWLAGKGVPLMGEQPILVTGLLIGTIIGVAFLGGIPVGPLIAAGILALLLGKI